MKTVIPLYRERGKIDQLRDDALYLRVAPMCAVLIDHLRSDLPAAGGIYADLSGGSMILEDGMCRIFAVDERGRARRLLIQAILRRSCSPPCREAVPEFGARSRTTSSRSVRAAPARLRPLVDLDHAALGRQEARIESRYRPSKAGRSVGRRCRLPLCRSYRNRPSIADPCRGGCVRREP